MFRKILAIITTIMLLSATVIAIAEDDSYEGDAEGYYDDQLEKLDTVIVGDWQYMLLEDSSAAMVRYLGSQRDLLIPDSIGGVTVTAIYSFCFAADMNLDSVTLPKSITQLYEDSFMYCSASKIVLNDGLLTIGDTAFFSCSQLTGIKVPSTVEKIGNYAFENCAMLSKATLEEGLQEIGEGAFVYCDALQNLTVPKSVVRIGDEAFPSRPDFTLEATEGSFAASYAAQNKIAVSLTK